MTIALLQVLACALLSQVIISQAWVSQIPVTPCLSTTTFSNSFYTAKAFSESTTAPSSSRGRFRMVLSESSAEESLVVAKDSESSAKESLVVANDEGEDDDDEYEYVEYDVLTDKEFIGSEWLVGTVMDNRLETIAETWVRLVIDEKGKNIAVWGDNSGGVWNWDTANQFLSVSKNSLVGKNIWAGVVDDYYFVRGTVRGWNFFSPASVVGQWQARRLGVEKDEVGVAPWFEEPEEEEADETPTLPKTTESTDES